MKRLLLGFSLLFCGAALVAQTREFLTDNEIDQVREAQEGNDRMKLYIQFARARLDGIEKELAATGQAAKPLEERGARIHDLLHEYGKILDAIDDLSDVAQTQKVAMRKGVAFVARNEPELLKRLQAIEEKNPPDREAYRFVLTEAIEGTQSSLEEIKKLLGKLPTDKKLEKEIEAEQKQDELDRKKPPPKPPNNPQ
jgi:septal ring factor EnvC (AmiA/AmiB activator)